jgi:hypothetical protein
VLKENNQLIVKALHYLLRSQGPNSRKSSENGFCFTGSGQQMLTHCHEHNANDDLGTLKQVQGKEERIIVLAMNIHYNLRGYINYFVCIIISVGTKPSK